MILTIVYPPSSDEFTLCPGILLSSPRVVFVPFTIQVNAGITRSFQVQMNLTVSPRQKASLLQLRNFTVNKTDIGE